MGSLPLDLLIKIINLAIDASDQIVALWKKIHADDPANLHLTNAEIFDRIIAKGDAGSAKWREYIANNP